MSLFKIKTNLFYIFSHKLLQKYTCSSSVATTVRKDTIIYL